MTTCRTCRFYDIKKEHRRGSTHERLSYCSVIASIVNSISRCNVEALTAACEPSCDEYEERHEAVGCVRSCVTGDRVGKGWPRGLTREEAIKKKAIIMARKHPAWRLAEIVGIKQSTITMVWAGRSWYAVPWEGER